MSYVPPSWSDGPNDTPPPPSRPKLPKIEPAVYLVVGVVAIVVALMVKQGRLHLSDLGYFVVIIPSIILHEISHGALANFWGDSTAKRAGRLTLNPLRHIDPIGTVILPGALILLGAPAFGYAKPVPVNTTHMSRNKTMLVGLIGPITNLVLMVIGVALLWSLDPSLKSSQVLPLLLFDFALVNVHLAAFNVIPIPPLDGASIIERFLPSRYWPRYLELQRYSMVIFLLIFLVGQRFLSAVFVPADWLLVQTMQLFFGGTISSGS